MGSRVTGLRSFGAGFQNKVTDIQRLSWTASELVVVQIKCSQIVSSVWKEIVKPEALPRLRRYHPRRCITEDLMHLARCLASAVFGHDSILPSVYRTWGLGLRCFSPAACGDINGWGWGDLTTDCIRGIGS